MVLKNNGEGGITWEKLLQMLLPTKEALSERWDASGSWSIADGRVAQGMSSDEAFSAAQEMMANYKINRDDLDN